MFYRTSLTAALHFVWFIVGDVPDIRFMCSILHVWVVWVLLLVLLVLPMCYVKNASNFISMPLGLRVSTAISTFAM